MGKRKDLTLRVSVPRRIMLLLHDNMKYADSFEVPDTITQSGIGRELDLRQTHVSRALSELDSEGLIGSRSAHIKGAGRRRKAYFLSRRGVQDTDDFIEELMGSNIGVRMEDGQLKLKTVERTLHLLSKRSEKKVTLYQLMTGYYDGSEINLLRLGSDNAEMSSSAPLNRAFFGREEEISEVARALDRKKTRFIVIKSIAGGGKTSLMARISRNIEGRPMKWTVINEWMGPENLLSEWAHFLNGHGRPDLHEHLRQGMRVDMNDSIARFIKGCRGLSPVFMIDDLHRGPETIGRLLRVIREKMENKDDIKFILTTREMVDFYGKIDLVTSDDITEIELEGLDKKSAFALLGDKGIPSTEHENAYRITGGHPLALELYSESSSATTPMAITEFEEYLGKEVLKCLLGPERDVLRLAAVFDQPVPAKAFFFSEEITAGTLDRLSDMLILRKYKDGTYDVHDLVRSYFRNRMTDVETDEFVGIACAHLAGRGTDREILEHLRILEASGRKEELVKRVLEEGEHLMSRGYGQVRSLLDRIEDGELKDEEQVKLLLLRSDAAHQAGDLDRAKRYLEKGLDICDSLISSGAGDRGEVIRSVSRIYHRSAEISRAEGKMGGRIQAYRKSVRHNRKYGDDQGLGKALNNLAMAQRDRGELNEALRTLNEAEKTYSRIDDRTSTAFVEVNMATVHFLKRDREAGIKHLRSAQMAPVRYPMVRGRLLCRIGDAWSSIGEQKRAEEAYRGSLEAFRDAGSNDRRVEVLLSLFDNRLMEKDQKKAKEYLTAASRLHSATAPGSAEGVQDALFSAILMRKVLFDAGWGRTRLRKSMGSFLSPVIECKGAPALREIEELSFRLEGAADRLMLLDHALAAFKKYKDPHPSIILRIWKLELLREMGDKKGADELHREVLIDAKKAKFEKALKRLGRKG